MNRKELEAKAHIYLSDFDLFIYPTSRELENIYITGFLAGRDAAAKIVEPDFGSDGFVMAGGKTAWDKIKALGEDE